ncbi:MAG TPA: hypothetical protein VF708_17825 [Pyrinomonadaceae bacterium]|jgi:hypothetical protein
MKNKLLPAFIGGGSIFLLLLLLSLIPGVRCCTIILTILGGVLAAYLLIRKSQTPVSKGEGVIVGALAGAVTGVFRLAFLAISYLLNRDNIQIMLREAEARMRQFGVEFNENSLTFIILAGIIFGVVLLVVLEALGGLLGVTLFEKRNETTTLPPPPPPPTLPGSADAPGGIPGL